MSKIVNQIFQSPVFETERLIVGRWHIEFADAALKIYGDPEVTQWIGGITETSPDSMRQKIAALIERNSNWPDHWGSWPTFSKATRELVGTMLMKPLPDAAGNCTPDIEIGWHLGRAHWGKGFATEGGRQMIEIAFNDLKIPELSAVTGLDNQRSQNVARRLDMTHVGQTDAYYGQTVELFKIVNTMAARD